MAKRSSRHDPLLAAIDIGSTAVRMTLAQYMPESEPQVIEELSHPISTAADSFRHGSILPGTITSICEILTNYLDLLHGYDVHSCRVIASSALREADNREVVADRIRHRCGIDIYVLDAAEESRLVFKALEPWLGQRPSIHSIALNLGGGSTDIMVLRGLDLLAGGVRRLGTSRLFYAAGQGSSASKTEILHTTAADIAASAKDMFEDYSISRFFVINRLLSTAFAADPLAETHARDFVLPAEHLRRRLESAFALSTLELGQEFDMGLADAEILLPAMVILYHFIQSSGAEEVIFPDTEMLSGLIREMAMEVRGINPLMAFRHQILRSAQAVGSQYFYDRAHARAVTSFAMQLFDALRTLLDLDDHARLLLETAATLHDIGKYISPHRHNEHSAYLIRWADIAGISDADRELIAQTALFHRRELPETGKGVFGTLPMEQRILVRKLGGILRMADGLDRDHAGLVRNVRVNLTDTTIQLGLETDADLDVISNALPRKSDLLSQVTGLQVVLQRENHALRQA